MSPLSVRMPFVLLLAFLPFLLLLLVFDPLPLPVLLLFTLPLFSRFLPPGGFLRLILLSVSPVRQAGLHLFSHLLPLPFLLFSCGFHFVFSFRGACLIFFIACALVLSVGGFRSISVFLPSVLPSSLLPLVISPLALLPFVRSSCGYLFCTFSYGVFSFSSSPCACSCLCSLWVHCTSALPSSGVSIGWGVVCVGFCTGVDSGSYRCFFSLYCLATSVFASSCGSFFLSSCFPASGCLGVLSSCLFSLAFVFLGVACLFCSWLGLSSAGFCGSLFTCGALPGAPMFSAASALPPFCSAPLGSAAGLYGFASPLSGTSAATCFLQ